MHAAAHHMLLVSRLRAGERSRRLGEFAGGVCGLKCAWHCCVQVKTIAEEVGVAFLGIGFDPKWQVADVPIMPKNRYRRAKLHPTPSPPMRTAAAPS